VATAGGRHRAQAPPAEPQVRGLRCGCVHSASLRAALHATGNWRRGNIFVLTCFCVSGLCRDGVREEAAAVRSFEEAGAAALRTQVRSGRRQGLCFVNFPGSLLIKCILPCCSTSAALIHALHLFACPCRRPSFLMRWAAAAAPAAARGRGSQRRAAAASGRACSSGHSGRWASCSASTSSRMRAASGGRV
jgi:hypothetical protein